MYSEQSFYIPPEGPPQGILPSPEIYAKMGEANIYRMLEDFYVELSHSTIRHLFPDDMVEASKKSAAFFVFILGGPPLYQQKHGPPMMRKRHLPFKIDEAARQAWLNAFRKVLENSDKKYDFPLEHQECFWSYLEKFSSWMVNTR